MRQPKGYPVIETKKMNLDDICPPKNTLPSQIPLIHMHQFSKCLLSYDINLYNTFELKKGDPGRCLLSERWRWGSGKAGAHLPLVCVLLPSNFIL